MFRAWAMTLLLVAPLLAIGVPGAVGQGQCDSAAVKCCGDDFELFIRNPDVAAGGDGRFHVSGDFFMQFQVIGDRADEVDAFAFSVGLPVDNPQEVCQLPLWPAGLMLEAYKVDLDGSDGFFILQNTGGQSTPQGVDLSVAVHAYDAGGTELARFWSTAVVESCPGPGPGGCDAATRIANDRTQPWPIILPGDGAATLVDGFTVEFAEELSAVTILLNGEDVTGEMGTWDGRLWDADVYYDYGPGGIFNQITPMCTLPGFHSCVTPGPAYEWTTRTMTPEDVIRVEAIDLAGNVAIKEIHIGSSVAGGAIADGLPVLTMTFANTHAPAAPGDTVSFQMKMENTGGGEGHPFGFADVPAGWNFEWVPGHKPVPAGGSTEQNLEIQVPLDAVDGDHRVTAVMGYRQGSGERELRSPLTVSVSGALGNNVTIPRGGDISDTPADEESPGVTWLVAPLLLTAAAWRGRRPNP